MKEAIIHGASQLDGKYLTFILGGEGYGIPVLKVREIIRLRETTALPKMPPHIIGVINLRGKIVPVFDLRIRFGLYESGQDERTCVIVTQIKTNQSGEIKLIGLVVDSVEEVIHISNDQIDPPPDFGSNIEISYIQGIGKIGNNVRMLLDLDRIILEDSCF
ncbi:MAG: chemotaxis protein CheW [Verrucomicrobia bacterium]|jgi:purine-binding chemotaxis protein CheW|nr:chemotaxis protein CheW [Verrucomicrobiota bacterium]